MGTLKFTEGSVSKYDFANIIISGATAQGSIKYMDNYNYAIASGHQVHVKGYAVDIAAGKYIDILPYEVSY